MKIGGGVALSTIKFYFFYKVTRRLATGTGTACHCKPACGTASQWHALPVVDVEVFAPTVTAASSEGTFQTFDRGLPLRAYTTA
jgi:hypothetical protein